MGARIEGPATVRYALAAGETLAFEAAGPDARTPADLLHFPNDLYLSQEHVPLGVVDFARGRSTVHGVVWTEDGHEWNPRWYGVVQRVDPGAAPRNRYVVRVK